MLRAVIFDLGGTLDGDAEHWLDRFDRVYAACGRPLPRAILRDAFDAAGRRAADDQMVQSMGLAAMVSRHLDWQFEHLGISDHALRERIVAVFTADAHAAGEANVTLLKALHDRGLALGVVSNGCGNTSVLCDEFGFAPFLRVTIDSRLVGVAKPDPAIFRLALERLERPADQVLMVGDSYDRDMLPSASLGMQTAWLRSAADAAAAGTLPYRPDIEIARLTELLTAIDARERTPA